MQKVLLIVRMSRPRFWSYLFGPFLIGYALNADSLRDFSNPLFWTVLVFFIFPANVILYGVNDYFDTETDKYSTKKKGKEVLDYSSHKKAVLRSIYLSVFLSALIFLILPNIAPKVFLVAFVLLAIAYSAPPFRFKKRVVLDFLTNVLYLTPAFVGMTISGSIVLNYALIISASFWVFAMHLFSAVPDIEADKSSNIRTTAVYFGQQKSLSLCFLFWSISYILLLSSEITTILRLIGVIYPLLAITPLAFKQTNLNKLYWVFPAINTISGMVLFFESLN